MSEITNSQPQDASTIPTDTNLRLVTGYDGSPPAIRALDAAAALLRGRRGSIEVVYVAHVPSVDMMSADALVQVEQDFDEIERDLRASAAEQLGDRGLTWNFRRRQGNITAELIAAAVGIIADHPGDTGVIVVGSSSHASHRVLGSVAVGLARHCPVPLVIVP
jgi:nucleotide-binding universal stress UspA family protein